MSTIYGNQEGAAKGYNPHKPGAKSYHPQFCFCTELKLILNSWFRTGSSYTSGYFNGELFDLLESEGHDYLVKVKLKNLGRLMLEQEWSFSEKNKSVCAFEYQAKGWKKKRTLRE